LKLSPNPKKPDLIVPASLCKYPASATLKSARKHLFTFCPVRVRQVEAVPSQFYDTFRVDAERVGCGFHAGFTVAGALLF
jgi:hypothetical protein